MRPISNSRCRRAARALLASALLALLAACAPDAPPAGDASPATTKPALSEYYGTLEPFASEAVYFVVTDRFVNGDPGNDQRKQGGAERTFDRPLACSGAAGDNVGYLGGDFRGLLDHADYVREMGFSALWITPIVDNPDEVFSGGNVIDCVNGLTDRGKTGYHGYWGVNFYRVDEHLPSPGLGFPELTQGLRAKGLKTVLDIVGNHSSPGWGMTREQSGFGKVLAADGSLLADTQNLPPDQLDPAGNPLHAFYNASEGLAQLADFNESNPAVMDYLAGAYLQWIDQGADAFRIDTVQWMPGSFWREFSARVRAKRPGFFMFGEAFDYDASKIAAFTHDDHGAISVLDFPLRRALTATFEKPGSDFAALAEPLYLQGGPYRNPYELTTFYDNHDMARMNASDAGFIDAHHWLFTARGIPVIYYGSEIGFMRGAAEHLGNRNYYGVDHIAAAAAHPIRQKLTRIAQLRAATPALQRGLQLNVQLAGDTAAFYRVLQHDGITQTALVLLNKGDGEAAFNIRQPLQAGTWRNALDQRSLQVTAQSGLSDRVAAHDVSVWLYDGAIEDADFAAQLAPLMAVYARPIPPSGGR